MLWTQLSWVRTRLLLKLAVASCGTMFLNIAFGDIQSVVRPTQKKAVTIIIPSRPMPRHSHFPEAPQERKSRLRWFDSVSTSRSLILASMFTLRKSASPSGRLSSSVVLDGHEIQSLIFSHQMLLQTGSKSCAVWRSERVQSA